MKKTDCKVAVAETGEPIGTAKAAALAALVSRYFNSEEHRKAFAEWLEQRDRKAERA